jgi:predicted dehydrogenase
MDTGAKRQSGTTRREFLSRSAAAGASAWAMSALGADGADDDARPIRVGLVGCGRRGCGAAKDCLSSSKNVSLVALADLFADQMEQAKSKLSMLQSVYQVPEDQCFVGFDAYQKLLACDLDLVLLATPPGFRPLHLRVALEAGKHVFMEKPGAVDPVGARSVMESAALAKEKNLAIVAGTQRRHQAPYVEIIKRIHDGDLGEILSASCYWIGDYGYYPAVLRKPEWSDMEWQLRNWNYFTWLSGDHIVEQHLHNIDVINWALQGHPIKAVGLGGRQQRTAPEYGHIYDHFAVEFEYPGGVRVESLCRQMSGCYGRVAENVVGSKGHADPSRAIEGEKAFRFKGQGANPYEQEHADLIASIRAGQPLNEGQALAESTMAAIMGRLAAYTGQEVTWDFVMKDSKLDLRPPAYEMGPLPVPPVAVPGEMQLT